MGKARITIVIPPKSKVLKQSCEVSTTVKGKCWSEKCLNGAEKDRGVYIFHHKSVIKYVGMTGGKKMNFGVRLRRHLQQSAAPKRSYERLKKLGQLRVSFLTDEQILQFVELPNSVVGKVPKSVILLMEAALIHAYRPEFQRGEDEPKSI
jgi:hypothetical protein